MFGSNFFGNFGIPDFQNTQGGLLGSDPSMSQNAAALQSPLAAGALAPGAMGTQPQTVPQHEPAAGGMNGGR